MPKRKKNLVLPTHESPSTTNFSFFSIGQVSAVLLTHSTTLTASLNRTPASIFLSLVLANYTSALNSPLSLFSALLSRPLSSLCKYFLSMFLSLFSSVCFPNSQFFSIMFSLRISLQGFTSIRNFLMKNE